jgi:hypothetical protein
MAQSRCASLRSVGSPSSMRLLHQCTRLQSLSRIGSIMILINLTLCIDGTCTATYERKVIGVSTQRSVYILTPPPTHPSMSSRPLRRLFRQRQQPPRKVDSKELVERFSADFNDQHDSPLFRAIPPELRNTIFRYACHGAPLKDEAYPHDAYYYRPGYEYPQRIYTDLLRTCRLVYLETRLLPVKVNEHVFWCERAPPGPYKSQPASYFQTENRFTEEQLDAIQDVHIFAQLWWLEQDRFSSLCQTGILRTQILHITIRSKFL